MLHSLLQTCWPFSIQKQWRKLTCQWQAWEIGFDRWENDSVQNQFKGTWTCSLEFNMRLSPLIVHAHGVLNSRCVQVTVVVVNVNIGSRRESQLHWLSVAGSGNVVHRVQKEAQWPLPSILIQAGVVGFRENSWLHAGTRRNSIERNKEKDWHLEKGLRTRERKGCGSFSSLSKLDMMILAFPQGQSAPAAIIFRTSWLPAFPPLTVRYDWLVVISNSPRHFRIKMEELQLSSCCCCLVE